MAAFFLSVLFMGSALNLGANVDARQNDKAIVQIECGAKAGTATHAGGGRYITAAHVIDGAPLCFMGGAAVSVVRADDKLDVAELSGPAIPASVKLDCGGFRAGEEYLAIGFSDVGRIALPLIFSVFGGDPDSGAGQFVGPDVRPGMSGGPIFSKSWRQVGITVQRWPARARALADTFFCKEGRVA